MPDLQTLDLYAARLDKALRACEGIEQPAEGDRLTLEQAYEVQRRLVALRLARGEGRAGVKLAFTQPEAQRKFGMDGPLWGRLMSGMRMQSGVRLELARYLRPRLEPEIAFILKRALPAGASLADAAAAVEAVMPALEIIDTRYLNFRLALPDLVADNASAAGFVLGEPQSPTLDHAAIEMVLEVDGVQVQRGNSAAIWSSPAQALLNAARHAASAGEELQAGDVIMAGCATEPYAVAAGHSVRLRAQGLGEVTLTTV